MIGACAVHARVQHTSCTRIHTQKRNANIHFTHAKTHKHKNNTQTTQRHKTYADQRHLQNNKHKCTSKTLRQQQTYRQKQLRKKKHTHTKKIQKNTRHIKNFVTVRYAVALTATMQKGAPAITKQAGSRGARVKNRYVKPLPRTSLNVRLQE